MSWYEDLIRQKEGQYGLPKGMLYAVGQQETGHIKDPGKRSRVESPAGAQGWFQFTPATAKRYGVDPFDVESAADGAARKLRADLEKLGSVELALAAYNAGEGAVARHGGVPPYKETQGYVYGNEKTPGTLAYMSNYNAEKMDWAPSDAPGQGAGIAGIREAKEVQQKPQFTRQELEDELRRREEMQQLPTKAALLQELSRRRHSERADTAANSAKQHEELLKELDFLPDNMFGDYLRWGTEGLAGQVAGIKEGLQRFGEGVKQSQMDTFDKRVQRDLMRKHPDVNWKDPGDLAGYTQQVEDRRADVEASPEAQMRGFKTGTLIGEIAPWLMMPNKGGAVNSISQGMMAGQNQFVPEGGDRDTNTAIGALGGIGGYALGKGMQAGLDKIMTNRGQKIIDAATPTQKQLKQQGRDLYKRVEKLGINFKPRAWSGFQSRLLQKMRDSGFNRKIQKKTAAAFSDFDVAMKEAQKQGLPLSFERLHQIRKQASNAAMSPDADEARMARIMIDEIDDFIDNIRPGQLTAGVDADQAGPLLREARKQWQKQAKIRKLESMVKVAESQASGIENGITTQFRQLLKRIDTGKEKGWTDYEIDAIREIASGGKLSQKALRFLGTMGIPLDASRNWLGTTLSTAGGAAAGTAAGIPLLGAAAPVAVGTSARWGANRAAQKAANRIMKSVASPKASEAFMDIITEAARAGQPNVVRNMLTRGPVALSDDVADKVMKAIQYTQDSEQLRMIIANIIAGGTPTAKEQGLFGE